MPNRIKTCKYKQIDNTPDWRQNKTPSTWGTFPYLCPQ